MVTSDIKDSIKFKLMKTIIKLSTVILFSIIFINAEAQKIKTENKGINRSEITQIKKYTGNNTAKDSKDSEADQDSNERLAYDAFGNAIWVPNSADHGSPINHYGSPYGNPYQGANNGPGSYYGNSYSNCGPNSNPYNYNAYGSTGWYTPFTDYNGWNNFGNSYTSSFYNEFNQPFDWNTTTGDYGLEMPRTGVWLDKVLGKKYHVHGHSGVAIYMHEDGFFYRGRRSHDGYHQTNKYLVLAPPVGLRVSGLPRTAKRAYSRGQEYFIANNVVFQKTRNRQYKIVGVLG